MDLTGSVHDPYEPDASRIRQFNNGYHEWLADPFEAAESMPGARPAINRSSWLDVGPDMIPTAAIAATPYRRPMP